MSAIGAARIFVARPAPATPIQQCRRASVLAVAMSTVAIHHSTVAQFLAPQMIAADLTGDHAQEPRAMYRIGCGSAPTKRRRKRAAPRQ
jgi:hypothetical protein